MWPEGTSTWTEPSIQILISLEFSHSLGATQPPVKLFFILFLPGRPQKKFHSLPGEGLDQKPKTCPWWRRREQKLNYWVYTNCQSLVPDTLWILSGLILTITQMFPRCLNPKPMASLSRRVTGFNVTSVPLPSLGLTGCPAQNRSTANIWENNGRMCLILLPCLR